MMTLPRQKSWPRWRRIERIMATGKTMAIKVCVRCFNGHPPSSSECRDRIRAVQTVALRGYRVSI